VRSLKSEERRTVQRYSLERMAKIQLGFDAPPTYCLVTDISEGGVRLYLNGLEVPDEFVLLLSGDGPRRMADTRLSGGRAAKSALST
jgi:hypothetical protein